MMKIHRDLFWREDFIHWHATKHLVAKFGENLTESFLVGGLEFFKQQVGVFIHKTVQLWSCEKNSLSI